MTYKLTIETDSFEDLFQTVSNLRKPATVVMQGEEAEQPVKKTRKSKATQEASEPVAELVKDEKPTEEVTYDEVKKATLNLIAKKGKPAALELLDQFGATSAQALKPEQFLEFVGLANSAAGRL